MVGSIHTAALIVAAPNSHSSSLFAFSYGQHVHVIDTQQQRCLTLQAPPKPAPVAATAAIDGTATSTQDASHVNDNDDDNDSGDDDGEEPQNNNSTELKHQNVDSNKKSKNNTNESDPETMFAVRVLSLSDDGRWLAWAGDDKQLHIYELTSDINNGNTSTVQHRQTVTLQKRPSAMTFLPSSASSSQLAIADKTGDVYQLPLPVQHDASTAALANESQVTLGHLAIVTQLIHTPYHAPSTSLSTGGSPQETIPQFLLSSDHDGKVRVSCHPHHYDIHAFCLGQPTYIGCMAVVVDRATGETLLVTAGATNTLYLWNFYTGQLLQEYAVASIDAGQSGTNTASQQQKQFVTSLTYNQALQTLAVVVHPSVLSHSSASTLTHACDTT